MKTRISLILTIFLTGLLLLSSCIITSREVSVDISCDKFTNNPKSMRNEFEVEIGDKIHINLCSNQTTGFKWNYTMTVDGIIKEEDYDFEEPTGDVVGAAGTELWTFEAVEKGKTEVRMEYSQPWAGGTKAEWIYTFTVTVN